ncbi:NAD(P)/FAD-dependent oxidoreductase [Gracilibacillus oryzae]|uniref:Ferredoxin--NADP reductase n=1 Tax=Gracilibacillus oryzae TaxID=1672701 RepID=A0A7C8KZB2_9BACI|nr:NAD(P)/FAD-dependent oxidoreductase [Gracilibacillus oryzae]KAB8137928.1 NAD(P)/FAD-dependent oxidoreductase [Gracilibacillus oryzae]
MGEKFDLAIIGGGTTGLFAAYYATMRQMKVVLIEAQEQLGGKVMQFLPEKLIYDVGGFPEITGETLVDQMIEQANRHEPEILVGDFVEQIEKTNDKFQLMTAKGKKLSAETVMLATGTGTFHTRRPDEWAEIPDSRFKASVPTSLMDRSSYQDKKVVIASNSKVGIGWAINLQEIASNIVILNSHDTFLQAKQEELAKLQEAGIEVYYNVKITNFLTVNKELEKITFLHNNGQEKTVEADKLLTYHGLELQAAPFETWGISTAKGRISVDHFMKTNVEGIFAAGDIVQYPGKTTLIASGYTEAITAVNHAHMLINPKATEQLYSTVIYQRGKRL